MTLEVLRSHGAEEMSADQVQGFLAARGVCVLGLPDDGAPYLLPMSYGFDGTDTLYFTYVMGADSRKATLSEAAEEVSAVVYRVDTPYNWESVVLTGSLDAVPTSEWGRIRDDLGSAWDPELFAEAKSTEAVRVYAFEIDDAVGVEHAGLPPGFGDA